jgi:hypothetical protein
MKITCIELLLSRQGHTPRNLLHLRCVIGVLIAVGACQESDEDDFGSPAGYGVVQGVVRYSTGGTVPGVEVTVSRCESSIGTLAGAISSAGSTGWYEVQIRLPPVGTPPIEKWVQKGTLWQCPECKKLYQRAGQSHSCAVVSLEDHFRNRPRARELFAALRTAIEEAGGSVRLSIAKTRIGLITSITFAAVMVRKDYLRGHILMRRRVDSPRFIRVDDGPPYWVHHFVIRTETDLDDEFRTWLSEAYEVGGGT